MKKHWKLVLSAAAVLLLMTLSLLSYQRSSKELSEAKEALAAAQEELAAVNQSAEEEQEAAAVFLAERDTFERQNIALLSLYALQQHYSAKEWDACKALINDFECGIADSLPRESEKGITPPAERYLELKEAVEAAVK